PDELKEAPPILLGLVDPAGAQAVAFPISLSGSAGNPASVTRVIAGSNEIAIGVAKEFMLKPVQAQLDYLKAHPPSFTVSVDIEVGVDTPLGDVGVEVKTTVGEYSVTIDTATADWSKGMIITIKVEGEATTDSILPNASFSVTLKLQLTFSQGVL